MVIELAMSGVLVLQIGCVLAMIVTTFRSAAEGDLALVVLGIALTIGAAWLAFWSWGLWGW